MTVPSAQRIVAVGSTLAVSGRCRYLGLSFDSSAAADCDVTLYDDITATPANRLDGVRASTKSVGRQWYGPAGINCEAGIYVGAITGALVVTIYYIPQIMLGPGVLMDISSDQRVIHRFITETEVDDLLHGATV